MTSKSLFFKNVKQENVSRVWYYLVILVIFFLTIDIPLLMNLSTFKDNGFKDGISIQNYFANNFLSPDKNIIMLVTVIFVAILTAFILFSYVHSKQKLDLYHSLPVKRHTLYFSKFLSGYLFFAIPFLIQMLITFFIVSVKGAMSLHAWHNFIFLFITMSLFYMSVFSMTVISIMLTGTIVISIIAVVVLQLYTLLITSLKTSLVVRYFNTAVLGYIKPVLKLSPIDQICGLTVALDNYRYSNSGITYRVVFQNMLLILLEAVCLAAIGYFLYYKRKSENAGKAIVFSVAEPIVKCMIVIPLSLFVGIIFESIADTYDFNWYLTGVIIAFAITIVMMEVIFRFDFRAGLEHWPSIIFNGIVLVLILVVLDLDLFGYDAYIPKQSDISHISVSIEGIFDIYSENKFDKIYTPMDYRMQNIQLTDDNTYNLGLALSSSELNLRSSKLKKSNKTETYSLEDNHTIVFGYHLKNGKTIYRRYYYNLNDTKTKDMVAKVFESKEYKLGAIPIVLQGWNKDIVELNCEGNYSDLRIFTNEKEKNEFLNSYQNEFMKLTFDEVAYSKPLASVEIGMANSHNGTHSEYGYGIYASFEKTIAFFENHGMTFDMDEFLKNATMATVTYYSYDSATDAEFPTVEYTDKDQIREIVENCISYGCNNVCYEFHTNFKNYDYDVDITYYNEDGDKNYKYMSFFGNKCPEFVVKDFNVD